MSAPAQPDLFLSSPDADGIRRDALIDPTGQYRYVLVRKWGGLGSKCLCFIMLNPSTADASEDDQTIRKCMHFARREGLGGILVVNVFAYRSTDPKVLRQVDDPIGPENWETLSETAKKCKECGIKVVAAWGNNQIDTSEQVILGLFGDLWCLGTNANGSPKHPCYLANDTPLLPWAVGGTRV